MQDRPTSVELLEAAADFVDREIVPAIEGARQFQARVVANVMRIVAREIQQEDPASRVEVKALARLLGRDGPHLHSLEDLRKASASMGEELSARIRAGDADSGSWRAEVWPWSGRASRTNSESQIPAISKKISPCASTTDYSGKGDMTNG
jgi:uncharacterized protein DUF6285